MKFMWILIFRKIIYDNMAFPDGIGGAVKSICDPAILLGKDINSAAEAVQIIQNSNLKTTYQLYLKLNENTPVDME